MTHNGFDSVARGIEAKIAIDGIGGASEKELLILIYLQHRESLKQSARPFWVAWKPRDVTTAAIALLTALGVVGASAGGAATRFMGG